MIRQKVKESFGGKKTVDTRFELCIERVGKLDQLCKALRLHLKGLPARMAAAHEAHAGFAEEFAKYYEDAGEARCAAPAAAYGAFHAANKERFESYAGKLEGQVLKQVEEWERKRVQLQERVKSRNVIRQKFDHYRGKILSLRAAKDKNIKKGKHSSKDQQRLDRNEAKFEAAKREFGLINGEVTRELTAAWLNRFRLVDSMLAEVVNLDALFHSTYSSGAHTVSTDLADRMRADQGPEIEPQDVELSEHGDDDAFGPMDADGGAAAAAGSPPRSPRSPPPPAAADAGLPPPPPPSVAQAALAAKAAATGRGSPSPPPPSDHRHGPPPPPPQQNDAAAAWDTFGGTGGADPFGAFGDAAEQQPPPPAAASKPKKKKKEKKAKKDKESRRKHKRDKSASTSASAAAAPAAPAAAAAAAEPADPFSPPPDPVGAVISDPNDPFAGVPLGPSGPKPVAAAAAAKPAPAQAPAESADNPFDDSDAEAGGAAEGEDNPFDDSDEEEDGGGGGGGGGGAAGQGANPFGYPSL